VEVPVESVVPDQERQGVGIAQPAVDLGDGVIPGHAPDRAHEVARPMHLAQFRVVPVESPRIAVLIQQAGQLGLRREPVRSAAGGPGVGVRERDEEVEGVLGVRGEMQFESLPDAGLSSGV
jgi:hypothetical protein